MNIDPRDLFIKSNPTGLSAEELEKGRSGFVDFRSHSDYLIFRAGYQAATEANQMNDNSGQRDQVNTEGWKPEISIQSDSSLAAAGPVAHGLDKAEGDPPDLNFHLLALAERSCSLLEDWIQLSNSKDGSLTNQVRETRALLESQSPTWSTAIRDLLAERRRQIHVEGWSKEHDDTERRGELASAAATYALKAIGFTAFEEELWPWTRDWLKPGTPRAMLVKAGALILAELERLDRLSATEVHREN